MLKFQSKENRRIGQRVRTNAPIQLAIVQKPFWAFLLRPQFSGIISDISVRGMQLVLDRSLVQGTDLKLWVQVDHQSRVFHLVLRGEVMWSKLGPEAGSFLSGIQLTHLTSPDMGIWAASTLDEIRNFVS